MFEFRNGMLGVTIIALALAGAIVGGYLAGIDSVEHEVTRFNELADVSGLYEYDTNPQYIDYDPSSNYTGYFSENTGIYWPEEYVDYTPSDTANNYKIDRQPTDVEEDTYDMSSVESSISVVVSYADYPSNTGVPFIKTNPDDVTISLSELVELIVGDGSQTYLDLKSSDDRGDITNVQGEHCSVDWIVFTARSEWGDSSHLTLCSSAAWNYEVSQGLSPAWVFPKLSAHIDLVGQVVTLYYDNDMKDWAGTYSLDSVCVTFGGPDSGDLTINFGHSVNYSMGVSQTTRYLNPNYGVQLKG